jgi:hypothetical protein
MTVPDLNRVPPYYHKYISKVKTEDLNESLQSGDHVSFLKTIPAGKWDYRYAPGKWTIKELVQHIIDTERIFSYRALRFARKDATPLPGFEQDDYVLHAESGNRTPAGLIKEFEAVRTATAALFDSFTENQLESEGTASGASVYVRAIGFIILGHSIHHIDVLKERYLNNASLH